MKRYTSLPQAYLGMAFGFAVPMAFAAQTNSISLVAWIIYLAVLLWALVYDTMYAMVDIDDDLKLTSNQLLSYLATGSGRLLRYCR